MRYKYNQRLIQSDCVFDFDVAYFLLFFGKKLKLGNLTKLCLHGVAYDLKRLFKNFSDIFGQPEGRGRAIPIFRKC